MVGVPYIGHKEDDILPTRQRERISALPAEGTIRLPPPPVEGKFKAVYFLWFSMTYYILELDTEDYAYALVGSSSPDYLWILSRTPTLPR